MSDAFAVDPHLPVPIPLPIRPAESWPSACVPVPMAGIVGRRAELTALVRLLRRDDVRLVTLTGPGGVGKTRLALELGRLLAADFPDGVAFVPLAAVRDPALLAAAIARGLDLNGADAEDPLAAVANALGRRRVLLLLDNLEQIVPATTVVADLLAACPGVVVLATSRVRLGLYGGHDVPVAPLPVADPADEDATAGALARLANVDAVRLFAERARAADPAFDLTDANAPTVSAICRRLDGLPLAIELAANRMRVLSPSALLATLTDRLRVLTGGGTDQPARLRSLRDAVAWSFDLLSADEQAFFRRLGVFVGGFTLDAAEAVASRGVDSSTPPVLDLLTGLIDASLVARDSDPDANRFVMLETIRELALDRLEASGEVEAARDALAAWCLDLAERAEPELSGPDQDCWGNLVEAELPNIRAAHAYLDEIGDVERALRLGGALGWIWCSKAFFREGRTLIARLAALPGAADHPLPLAKVLTVAGDIESWLGDQEHAKSSYERALAIYREVGNYERIIGLVGALGSVAINNNDLDLAERLLTESRTAALKTDDAWEAAAATNLLGVVAFARGDYTLAIARHAEAERRLMACGDRGNLSRPRLSLARAAVAAGDAPRAADLVRNVLDGAIADDDEHVVLESLEAAAAVAWRRGDNARGARLFGTATRERERIGTVQRPATRRFLDRCADDLQVRLGEARFVEETATGQALPMVDAVDVAFGALRPIDVAARSRRARAGKPFGLTKRELEILPLLVSGNSDRAIAEALFIGRPTASKHVSAVMIKLGVSSRTAAAALAVREGLV